MVSVVTLIVTATVVAAAAAFRGTWSPCGLSMLSTVTPLAEAGRGHRYRWTASWFLLGAVTGGATTGVGSAALAAGVRSLDLSPAFTYGAAGIAAVLASALDAGLLGPPLPHHRRQVNEEWLGRYRAWVYGAGFGWQIGTGVATYIMTAGVYLVVVLGALTASPAAAFAIAVAFGACRGSMVLLGARLTSAERLRRFHQRFEAWREPVRRGVVVVEVGAVLVLAAAGGTTAVGMVLGCSTLVAVLAVLRTAHRSGPAPVADACSVPTELGPVLAGTLDG